MEIRIEQRNEYPPLVENIGMAKWHVRWNVQQVTEEGLTYHKYNEVTLDHEPSQAEIDEITAQ